MVPPTLLTRTSIRPYALRVSSIKFCAPANSMRAHVDSDDLVRCAPALRANQLRLAAGVEVTHTHGFGIGMHGHHLRPVTTRQKHLCPYSQLGKIHRVLLTLHPGVFNSS